MGLMQSFREDIMANVVRVAVTGAAGQVAYAMLGRLASGEVFGPNQKIALQLLEITPALGALEGVAMELEDCSFPTLANIVATDDAKKVRQYFEVVVKNRAKRSEPWKSFYDGRGILGG